MSNCSIDLDTDDQDFDLPPELHEKLNEYLAGAKKKSPEDPMKNLPRIVKDVLATQRLEQLFTKGQDDDLETGKSGLVKAKAALTSLDSSRQRALMRYRSLEIGTGTSGQVEGPRLDLSQFGYCKFASSRHAVIYFDQLNQVYELINYSEHGTIVDNVVYALDNLRPLFKAKRCKREENNSPKLVMASGLNKKKCYCECSSAKMLRDAKLAGGGCENSAVLKHGSYVRIGCLQFVFSILDFESGEMTVANMVQQQQQQQQQPKLVSLKA